MFSGLETRCFISNSKISKHQYYYQLKTQNKIKPKFISVYIGLDGVRDTILNTEIIALMRLINQDLDTDYGHRKMTALKLMVIKSTTKKYID
jgi:hypothetical protein